MAGVFTRIDQDYDEEFQGLGPKIKVHDMAWSAILFVKSIEDAAGVRDILKVLNPSESWDDLVAINVAMPNNVGGRVDYAITMEAGLHYFYIKEPKYTEIFVRSVMMIPFPAGAAATANLSMSMINAHNRKIKKITGDFFQDDR